MSLSADLRSASGVYFGTGDGPESGPFVSRIEIAPLPGPGVSVAYEATSREQGVQHVELALLTPGADGRDCLHISHTESPFVTEMVETETGSGRFAQPSPSGPYVMMVVIERPEPDRLTYAWWWGSNGDEPVEQSKADARLHS